MCCGGHPHTLSYPCTLGTPVGPSALHDPSSPTHWDWQGSHSHGPREDVVQWGKAWDAIGIVKGTINWDAGGSRGRLGEDRTHLTIMCLRSVLMPGAAGCQRAIHSSTKRLIPRLSTSVGKPFPLAWMKMAQLHTLGMGSPAAPVPNYRDGIPWDLDIPVGNGARAS